jgi:hypothetical protein
MSAGFCILSGTRFIPGTGVIMSALAAAAAVLVFLSGAAPSLTSYATEELARMSRVITAKHFRMSKCVALVTDHNNGITDLLQPLEIPVLQVHLPFETIKDSKIPTSGLQGAKLKKQPFTAPQRMIIEMATTLISRLRLRHRNMTETSLPLH